jgi:small subunit ribosomal protein S17
MKKDAGFELKMPDKKCEDANCPFHGTISVKGRAFKGIVTSAKSHKTVTVRFERRIYIPKYERYEKKFSKIRAHNPPCINAKEGEFVTIMETRPISKTKHFIVIQKGE